jgi:ABC-type sugar transport system substrate-binding protein
VIRSLLVLVLGIASLLIGCRPARAEKAEGGGGRNAVHTIGYAAPELSGGQATIMNGFIERAAAKGWKVLTSNASSDPRTQESQIDYFLSQGVDAIVAVPVNSTAICLSIGKARSRGVHFYTIDRAPIGCGVDMVVLSDNRMAGTQSGKALVDILRGRYGSPRGTVLELQGDLAQNVSQLRGRGFHDIVDRYPAVHVLSRETRWASERFASATEEVMATSNVDALYLHSDAIGVPAVLPVLARMGRMIPRGKAGHIAIVGVDGSPEALQAIRNGFVDQSSSQPIPDFGIIVEWMERDFARLPNNEGPVTREGASWSPAQVRRAAFGLELLLSTTSVSRDNVNDTRLWGNQ